VTKSLGKNMFILFMDRKGTILRHAVPRGQTVNADYYCKGSSQNVSFFQMKLVSFGSDHPPTPSK
jgi:hypothetical protein